MPLFRRCEGTYLSELPALRRMMPHLMPGRNEAAVAFELVVDLSKTLPWIAERNFANDREPVTLFQLILAAMLRTFELRPMLNRFVVGRRLYQRNDIEFSFAIKRAMRDDAGLTTTKLTFGKDDTLDRIGERMRPSIRDGRGGKETQSDAEMRLLTYLPRSVLRFLVWLQGALDYFNLLPAFMVRPDPLYASMFFANLGSVGIDSAFHHLYEYGTCPFFATVGRVKKAVLVDENGEPAVRQVVSLKFLFDERIADGFYCARSLEIFERLLANPELLVSELAEGRG